MPENGAVRWHATGLAVMEQCPRKFQRRYLLGEREEYFSAGSIIGRALHHAAQLGVEAQIAGQRAQLDYLQESAMAHFNGLVKEDEDGPHPIPWDEDPGSLLARKADLRELVALWWAKAPGWWRRWGNPIMAEEHFETTLWGHTVTGQIDMATERDVVVDWKSGMRPMGDFKAEREMQRLVYPAAYERLVGRFPSLVVFAQLWRKPPTKTQPTWTYKLNIHELEVDVDQKELLRHLLDDDQALVDAGVFPLNIQSPLCSADYCPFWTTCPAHLIKPLAERARTGEAEDSTVEETAE